MSAISVLPFEGEAAEAYGGVRAELEKRGEVIGNMDMLIAAHAKSKGFVIVTNNVREFERVEGLKLENWV